MVLTAVAEGVELFILRGIFGSSLRFRALCGGSLRAVGLLLSCILGGGSLRAVGLLLSCILAGSLWLFSRDSTIPNLRFGVVVCGFSVGTALSPTCEEAVSFA